MPVHTRSTSVGGQQPLVNPKMRNGECASHPYCTTNNSSASGATLEVAAYFDALDRQVNDANFDKDQLVKHDPSNETMPHLPQYHPSFSEAERLVTRSFRIPSTHSTGARAGCGVPLHVRKTE
jgi:hypothetical protein